MGLPVVGRTRAIDELASRPDALTVAMSLEIREVTGRQRSIVLTGWCLPLRPVAVTLRQRLRVTYYPGATEATAQVLGPHHTETVLKGVLLARYMADEGARYFVLREAGAETVVKTPEQARQIMMDICHSGQEVVVTWGEGEYSLTQRGFWRSFRCDEHYPQRMEWEAEFEWTANREQRVRIELPKPLPDEKGLLEAIKEARDAVLGVLGDLSDAYTDYIDQTLRTVDSLVKDIENIAQQGLSLAGKPAQFARSVARVAENVLQAVVDIQHGAIALVAGYRAVVDDFKALGTGNLAFLPLAASAASGAQTDDSMGTQAEAAAATGALQASMRRMRYEARELRRQAQAWLEPDFIALHQVSEGETLRKIATRYYGTPGRWHDIADANGLHGDCAGVGMILLIPR